MATAPTYCTHRQLKDVYPQVDSFDNKRPLYGWNEVSTNKYAAHNSGLTTQLFANGEDLGPAQSCLLYTSPSPRDATLSRMPSSA